MKRSLSSLLLFLAPALSLAQAGAPVIPDDKVEYIHLSPGELPSVRLTGDILYRLLVAELSATRGDFPVAAQTMLDLARETSDPRLAKRAFQFAMAERNMVRALNAAREWALLAPKDPEAVASSLALSASNGQTSGLAAALRARIEKADNKEQAVAQASVIVNKMSDKALALKVLEQALDPSVQSFPITHLALADAAWAAEQPRRALAEARKAQELDPKSDAAAQRILEYGLKVDPERAFSDTRAFIERHPGSRQLQLMLVNRLVTYKKFDQALQQVARMRAQSPEDFDLLYTEAEVNTRAERYDQARALLHEYIQVQTQRRQSINDGASNAVANTSDARLLLVQIAEKQGDIDQAIAQLDLIDEPSMAFQAQVHKAVLLGRKGDLSQARSTLNRIKPQNDRERSVIALTMASVYRDAGRTDMAVDILRHANTELPDSPDIKYDLAMLYERQGKYDDFETLMRRVIELEPDNANAYNSLGYTLADRNVRLDEAQELLDQAIELEPDNPYIQDSVGWYFYRVGDYDAAIEYLQRSYRQLPSAEVAAHLGEVLWVAKRQDQARRIFKEGLARDASSEILLETMKRLGVSLP
jgi:tetratricopeptide (TPR) repeat protein